MFVKALLTVYGFGPLFFSLKHRIVSDVRLFELVFESDPGEPVDLAIENQQDYLLHRLEDPHRFVPACGNTGSDVRCRESIRSCCLLREG